MARPKKQIKVKEPVRLRYDKLKNGNQSLYLDTYYNGRRTIQYLKLYLVPETDVAAKIQNANTLAQANAIKAEKIMDLTNKSAGITDRSYKARMLFTDWMQVYRNYVEQKGSKSAVHWVNRVISELTYYNNTVILAEVDRDYILGFLERLQSRNSYTRTHAPLAKRTVFLYLAYIRAGLNYAVKENLLQKSPFVKINADMLSGKEAKREYLTVEEVKRLVATPCKHQGMKAAFLFSCFCGLRISDIKKLCWKHVHKNENRWQVEIIQYKTGKTLYLPLNMNARKWIPEQSGTSPDDPVFPTLTISYKNTLINWARKAGIDKKFSFHVGRHTFATLALTAGVDIYTTSQLLGHATIRHTQRYAKIINSKRIDAVSLLDGIFI